MNEYRVSSFAELHDALGEHRKDAGWMYRGQADPEWPLVPRAGRAPFDNGYDEIFFRRWKGEALQFLEPEPANDWECLAIAQHHGFATRLLDWTMRPLAAAYFAVAEPGIGESVIYCFKTRTHAGGGDDKSPFQVAGIHQFVPRHVASRVSREIGWFTLHGPSTLSIEDGMSKDDRLEKIIIDASYREELLFELNQYGVNSQSLFPNLVGLSRHFNWVMASFDYWAEGLTGGLGTRR